MALTDSSRLKRLALCTALFTVVLVFGLAVGGASTFYNGRTPQALASTLNVNCLPQQDSCQVSQQDLGSGRHALSVTGADSPAALLRLGLPGKKRPIKTILLLRIGGEGFVGATGADAAKVIVYTGSGEYLAESAVEAGEGHWPGPRLLLPLPAVVPLDGLRVHLSATNPTEAPETLHVAEVGIYPEDPEIIDRLTNDRLGPYLVRAPLLLLGAISAMLLSITLLELRTQLLLGALFVLLTALALFFVSLNLFYSPFWFLDGRAASASLARVGFLPNLTYGLHMALNVLEGQGPLLESSLPPFHRMPGYAYFLSLGGWFLPRDLFSIALSAFTSQALFNAAALALFFLALARYATPLKSLFVSLLVLSLPNQIHLTQVDTIMVGVYLLTAAAGLTFLDARRRGPRVPLLSHFALHGSFAIWLALRPDVLPGWVAISVLLYARRSQWRYLLIPFVLAALICVPWGLFKMQFTGEFAPTTSSIGWSLVVALGEIPNPFGWNEAEGLASQWLSAEGFEPTSKKASDFAIREVLRVWTTFPGNSLALVWHKLTAYFHTAGMPGVNPRLFLLPLDHEQLVRSSRVSLLLAVPAVALAVSLVLRFQLPQLLLLGWAFFFNLPVFLIVWSSSGRFYSTATASLIVTATVLLLDSNYYRAVRLRPLRTCVTIAFVVTFLLLGQRIDAFLLSREDFRFAAPFLDPKASSLMRYTESL